jgi:hypothetical protein
MTAGAPAWLGEWRCGTADPAAALERFDSLDSVAVGAMLGRWRGVSLPTGHPLDGLLEALGWWGKAFEAPDRVHPLLFRTASGTIVPIEPPGLLVRLGLQVPALGRTSVVRRSFSALLPLLRTRRHAARVELRTFRGRASAAMVYDRLPITDHFRRIDDDRVLGLMVLRTPAAPSFFFELDREHPQIERTA